jgi:hypothetical protein
MPSLFILAIVRERTSMDCISALCVLPIAVGENVWVLSKNFQLPPIPVLGWFLFLEFGRDWLHFHIVVKRIRIKIIPRL